MRSIGTLLRLTGLGLCLLLTACGSTDNSSSLSSEASSVTLSSSSASSTSSSAQSSSAVAYFTNPLFANGADPWLQFYQGNYYLVTTTWNSQLVMRKSPTIAGLKTAAPVYIWSATSDDSCCNFWAFEFHRLQGPSGWRWYVILTSGHQPNLDRQHLSILESEGDDPMGPYRFAGSPMPNTWNIDGTYLQFNSKLYLLWSEWDGALQKNWIQQMSNPWTVSGSRQELTAPVFGWETQRGLDNAGNVTEAPEVLQRNGRTFVSYSASSCNGPDYKLGLLELVGNNPLSASSWHKFPEPVFQKGNGVFGPGHNGFFTSPDGTEDWLVYHANPRANLGCGDSRSVRVQPLQWRSDGLPVFGEPAAPGAAIKVPAGEQGPLRAQVQGAPFKLINDNSDLCLSKAQDGSGAVQSDCGTQSSDWVLDATADGYYRLAHPDSQQFLSVHNCSSTAGADIGLEDWHNSPCQQWQLQSGSDGWIYLSNVASGMALEVGNCASEPGAAVSQRPASQNTCQRWRIGSDQQLALVSAQSGKAVEIPNCQTTSGSNVQQWEWLSTPCQKWTLQGSDSGFIKLRPSHQSTLCLAIAGNSGNSGNVQLATCGTEQSDWRIQPLADGSLALRNRDGRALDLANCDLANGANIGAWSWLDNQCQRFQLRKVIP